MMRTSPRALWPESLAIAALALSPALPAIGADPAALPTVAEGWKLELIASAPKIRHTASMICAPDGKLFVGEDPMEMGTPVDQPMGRILCFHPDGHVTVFAEHLYSPWGMRYIDGKLYVHNSPKFSVFKDDDGVGRDRVDLIDSDNPAPWGASSRGKDQINDHIPSGFELAMDGYFYISVGDKGVYNEVGKDGSKLEMRMGGVMRMRPDGTHLEQICSGFRNTLDVATTSQDEMFVYDNSDHLNLWPTAIGHAVDGGYYGYPYDYRTPEPYTLPMMKAYAGGAPTCALAYQEDALPPEYRDNLFLCDWGRREVLRVALAPAGGTYQVAQEEKLLHDETGEFRPTGIAVSPDGLSIYVGDWNFGGWRQDRTVGRLFKVTWQGKNFATPKPGWYEAGARGQAYQTSIDDLVQGLKHPARSVRMFAQRRLVEHGAPAVTSLQKLLMDTSAPAFARWHAIWALDAISESGASRDLFVKMLDDADPTVRLQALRELGTRAMPSTAKPVQNLLKDGEPRVRFWAATALGRIGEASSVPALLGALGEQDRFARNAVFTALNRIGKRHPDAWRQIAAGLESATPTVRDTASFAFRETYDPALVIALSALAEDTSKQAASRKAALGVLASLYRQPAPWNGVHWRTSPIGYTEESHETAPYLPKTEDWAGTPGIALALAHALNDPALNGFAVSQIPDRPGSQITQGLQALFKSTDDVSVRVNVLNRLAATGSAAPFIHDTLEHATKPTALVEAAVTGASGNADDRTADLLLKLAANFPELRAKCVESLGKLKLPDAPTLLASFAKDEKAPVRSAVATALAAEAKPEAVPTLTAFLGDSELEIRSKAIAALGNLKATAAIPALIEAEHRPETRMDAISALVRMPDARAIDVYLDGLAEKNPAVRDNCAKAISALKPQVESPVSERIQVAKVPPAMADELRKIFGNQFIAQSADVSPERYDAFAAGHTGNPQHGREIFVDANGIGCIRCHFLQGKGGDMGPDLTHIGANYTRAELIESVLYPSKKILGDYQQFTLEMKNGDTFFGSVRNETADSLVIVDAEGKKHPIVKSEIVNRVKSELSPMPPGLQAALSLQDFADLISFLQSLK